MIGPCPVCTVSPAPGCDGVGGILGIDVGMLATGPNGTTVPADEGATAAGCELAGAGDVDTSVPGESGETDIALGPGVGDAAGAAAPGAVRFENHAEIADQFV